MLDSPSQTSLNGSPTTDFGYKTIPLAEKTAQVGAVFHSVASKYDLMNDLMSCGMHRLWKKFTVELAQIRRGDKVLDVAGGTGDLSKAFAKRVGEKGKVTLLDINAAMLAVGRERLIDAGLIENITVLQANAEMLPFAEDYFDCLSIAFGLRNVTDKLAALRSMYRILKPGGRLLVLEFSKPVLNFLQILYDRYSFDFLPKLGQWIANDAASYQYLVESIRRHPDQESLKSLILEAGFDHCEYHNLSGGIVALHRAWKF
ncbi:bifunctional demethylmenaquinone methyltransferase/2-methoxy-6-polyprenyl-1,4-benzoquinol methylase UbiE [Rickettsiella endosymbiont of Dermanyssus gallinae]|uniref:bifunctional demethylmenaquinone methyltransferase/2-methoxy-6-polyprenyl-1,4-benzoquinol methylase UbiE n=1 Tax=Rickettsiella endosymbiont of Dermanyssus gallinae TaxID=2856608 RepID=UPI001C529A25|nr:bifunctional demethylmenaquinone methyltransferase/2-methoxy-6-polyprenyl-1,4-benzoquinol methylase UbiE [Rickettsiella endosymbiont of Dermanyssus gallinae]